MNFVVICEGLAEQGAVAAVAWQQALGLSRSQTVCLITDALSPERRQQLNDASCSLRLRVLAVPRLSVLRRFAHLSRQLLWIHRALAALGSELSSCKTAVVLCHSHPVAAAVAWRFGARVRLVMISHGDPFLRPPGSYDPAIHWLYRRCTRPAHRHAFASVALSPSMARQIRTHAVPQESIHLIPNGLAPAEIGLLHAPQTDVGHWQQRPLRLLFVGRLDSVKGLDVLLEALVLLQRRGVAFRLDLIAAGTTQQWRDLLRIINGKGLSSRVHLLGRCPRTSLAAHYLESNVVVVPSRDDPLPTVVLARMEGPKGLPAPVTTCTLTLPCSTVVKLRECVPPPGRVEPGGGERT